VENIIIAPQLRKSFITEMKRETKPSGRDHIRPHYQYPHHLCSIVVLPSERPFLWKRSWTANNLHMLKDQTTTQRSHTTRRSVGGLPEKVGNMGLILAEES
jgi:hypothetical protein